MDVMGVKKLHRVIKGDDLRHTQSWVSSMRHPANWTLL